ncbi:response regulator transcription factor [Mucilaginibacter lappiensis]|uniref:DNA-binding CsgD family transcriptional regulator n=1 Tax=Mucilaginibacter lappiensis TaxID=354630 RepID=A0A1N7DW59_9SPHI|nr:LuxR C-terminal-related transcriptional regulator [Mucilaginibacter lappiensis]MBB6111486.1 DNA-binding CsgD family transcriptional regulator [Mucilaginibacter lappiensis]MBB6130178.1 DNA-binding CsgD family transcriptional regulator [Mucilaginibacter lappiensis]SIR80079.1 regulatory protein, luxR family [Mucilaginibacter lappiensis]
MTFKLFIKNKRTILYGVALAVLLFLLKWLEFHFIIINNAYEVYIGTIAVLFTLLGIWLALKLTKPKVQTVVVEKQVYINHDRSGFSPDQRELERLNLSRRELEVLELMAEGLSNQEISARLFVSLNTIKTHSSNLFDKMDVKRRTQAIEMAKRLCIIP